MATSLTNRVPFDRVNPFPILLLVKTSCQVLQVAPLSVLVRQAIPLVVVKVWKRRLPLPDWPETTKTPTPLNPKSEG